MSENPVVESARPVRCEGFIFPVVGVSYRQEAVRACRVGQQVILRSQPENPHDPNAIAVYTEAGEQVGYVPKALAPRLAQLVEEGTSAEVTEVLTGETWGLRVKVHGQPARGGGAREEAASRSAPVSREPTVRAKSGRFLGGYAGRREGRVLVALTDGTVAEFPEGVVVVEEAS